jgi:outer membrane protein assembly factor BamB
MKNLAIIFPILAGLILGPGFAGARVRTRPTEAANARAAGQSEAASQPAPQGGPDQAVAGGDLQRTRAFRTKALQRPATVSWETRKIFEMEYVHGQRYSSMIGGPDPATGMNRLGGDGALYLNTYFFETGHDFSDPVIADGTLYFNVYIGDGYLIALDLNAMREKWTFRLKREPLSEPAVSGGTVFVGGNDGTFYALDAKTGQEKWKFKNKDRGYAYSSPLVEGSVVFFGSLSGSYYAADAATGKLIWTFKTKHAASAAAISGDMIYFGAGDELFALDKKTGEKKWSTEARNWWGTPAIADGSIFFKTGDAYCPSSGRVKTLALRRRL